MPIRISPTVDEVYTRFQTLMREVKNQLIGTNGLGGIYARSAALSLNWHEFVNLQSFLTAAINSMDLISSTSGIADYVTELEADPTYDVATEYTAMRNSVVAIRDWIFNNLPKANSGGTDYLLVTVLAQDGSLTDRTFSSADTAAMRTLIDTFRTTVL